MKQGGGRNCVSRRTMVWNKQELRCKYWATRSSARSFACTDHSFACFGLLASRVLLCAHSFACSLTLLTCLLVGKCMIPCPIVRRCRERGRIHVFRFLVRRIFVCFSFFHVITSMSDKEDGVIRYFSWIDTRKTDIRVGF